MLRGAVSTLNFVVLALFLHVFLDGRKSLPMDPLVAALKPFSRRFRSAFNIFWGVLYLQPRSFMKPYWLPRTCEVP